jgi:FKBP-type peptidyl-prolyl cis-trans isomerase SlyD
MKISPNKVVTVTYELQTDDENGARALVETADESNPLVFLYGVGSMIPRFEEELAGLTIGDAFTFSISPEEGYGIFDDQAVTHLPIDVFKTDGVIDFGILKVGSYVPLTDQDGNVMRAKVVKVFPDSVLMDFNHPMAGKNLHFKGKVVQLRNANPDELSHGHVHGDGGVHH